MTDPLESFRSQLLPGGRHVAVAEAIFHWLMGHCACARGANRHAMDAFVAATYEIFCAPADATLHENILGAQYVAVTLLADDDYDGPPDLDPIATLLHTGHTSADSELLRCYHDVVTGLRRRGPSSAGFEAAQRDTIDNRLRERRTDMNTVGWAEHWAIRRHTIAVAPYVWCHRLARAIELPAAVDAELAAADLLGVVSECVARGNDIASYNKEQAAAPADAVPVLNSVLHYARDLGGLEPGLNAAIGEYHTAVAAFERLITGPALERLRRDVPGVADYVDILRAVLAGNLRAIRHLSAARYPGTARLLDELLTG
ncbi:MAG: hypothetical protein J2P18_02505 [Nocardia sp.]|nr:hypothetical protein [Nocardia sp.]